MERFDGKHSKTSLVELNNPKQTKPLHMFEDSIHPIPLQKIFEEARILHNTLLEARSLSPILGQEGMKIPFEKRILLLRR